MAIRDSRKHLRELTPSRPGIIITRDQSVALEQRPLAFLEVLGNPEERGLTGKHAGRSGKPINLPGLEVLESGDERGTLSILTVNQGLADGLKVGIRRDDSTHPLAIRGGALCKVWSLPDSSLLEASLLAWSANSLALGNACKTALNSTTAGAA